MNNFFEDFTIEEKERINQLYGHDFEGATPDDIKLICRWEQASAKSDTVFQEQLDQQAALAEAKLKEAEETAELARKHQQELHDAIMARYEQVI